MPTRWGSGVELTERNDGVPIGRLLVRRGVVNLATVEAALSSPGGSRLCSKLLDAGSCDEGDLAAALAERHGLPGIDLSRSIVDLAALDLVPRGVAESDTILPLSLEGGRLHLAVASPERAERLVAEVRFVTGRDVSVYVAVLSALREAIADAYRAKEAGAALWRGPAAPAGGPAALEVRSALARPADVDVDLDLDALPELLREEVREGGVPIDEEQVAVSTEDDGGEVVHALAVASPARRVLVVDDEPAIRLLARRALESRGHVVEEAADGEEALAATQVRSFDVVLLDAMLPRLHGFEVARRLRSDPATRALPIVIMTAVYRGWRFAQDARESYGAQDYVEKPFRVNDLVRRVEAVLAARPAPAASSDAEAFVARGAAAAAAGDLDEAAEAYQAAVRADAFFAAAHHGLGEALRARGDGFRAMSALERAVELAPGLFAALEALAALYRDKGFRAKAAETLERAVRAAPDEATRERLRREVLELL
jgi:CheY-like chemotaxis protein